MHWICGLVLSCIFQLAHVMPNAEFPTIDEGKLDMSFEEHQLHTTANFSQKSPVFTWLIGGLNYQIEHHLFPDIPSPYYRELSPKVEKLCHEFGIPYNTGRFSKQYSQVVKRILYYSLPEKWQPATA